MDHRYELLSGAISTLYHDIQKIERVEMAGYGLKGPHAQCLFALNRCPQGATSARLCELCEKDKAAISRTVSELEEAGLVSRVAHNGSRYRAMLVLTESGRETAGRVTRKVALAVEQAGEGIEDARREVFYSVLARISENLHTICKEGIKEGENAK